MASQMSLAAGLDTARVQTAADDGERQRRRTVQDEALLGLTFIAASKFPGAVQGRRPGATEAQQQAAAEARLWLRDVLSAMGLPDTFTDPDTADATATKPAKRPAAPAAAGESGMCPDCGRTVPLTPTGRISRHGPARVGAGGRIIVDRSKVCSGFTKQPEPEDNL